jgi:tetratricopeptide (TPR) repeat protein
MSDNREKVMQVAEKLVARGKLTQAIKEYRKLLRFNPNDASTLNRVGDLYARQNNVPEAVNLFTQIAETYTKDGFFVKAIAIYKKIIRLDPTQLEVYGKLAELYHRQGLVNDARSQYQVVADYHLNHGDRAAAIDVHRKMAEVEPQNPSHRVKLAELYLEENLVEEAMGEYQRIAEVMLEHGHVEEAAKVYRRALDVDNQDLTFVSEAVLRLREDGHDAEAERLFRDAVERNPDAARLDELMREHPAPEPEATTAVEGPPDEAPETPTVDTSQQVSPEELEEIAASSELPGLEVTTDGAYVIEIAEQESAVETVDAEQEIDLDLAELEVATESVDAAPSDETPVADKADPLAQISALAQSVRSGKAPTDDAVSAPPQPAAAEAPAVRLSELLAEAEVFAKYGLESKAVRRLEQALEVDATNADVHRRLVLLWIDRGNQAQVIESAQRMLDTVPEGIGGELWAEVLGRLSGAGFGIEDGRVVRREDVAPETTARAEPLEAEEEEAGLEWLQKAASDSAAPGILFEAEEEFFDLAAELEKELVEAGGGDGKGELPEPLSVEDESLADIVEGFKKGVAEVLSPEAYDTHYNLGIAYREMGLVDEAIGEFQMSAKDPAYLVDSCSMLGACFLEKGFADLAVKWYKRGLESPDLSEEESLSLLYDLGSVHALAGEREAAYGVFVEIYGVNSHYRDVVARIEELRGE